MPHNPLRTDWQRKFLALEVHHPALQLAGDEIQYFCHRWIMGDHDQSTVILVGQPGCGKTHLLKRLESFCRGGQWLAHKKRSERAKDFLPSQPSIMYMFWPTIAHEFAQDKDWPVHQAIDVDLLLWDDLGAENDPWKKCADKACQILSRREKKFTVITTNVQPVNWAERFDQRIADRLLRNSVVVDMSEVPSYATR